MLLVVYAYQLAAGASIACCAHSAYAEKKVCLCSVYAYINFAEPDSISTFVLELSIRILIGQSA
jgi:hypothetical protein